LIQEWFSMANCVVDSVQRYLIYKFDETGFAIGIISAQKVLYEYNITVGSQFCS
jgi:hypothetical protein